MKAAVGGSVEGSIPSIEYPSPILPPPANIPPVVKAAKGGSIKSQTQLLLKQGGMMDDGGTKDPISGNEVPIGAMQEEVRDDVPAQLSEGEFVIPADVVRYIGLERLMMMRQAAKEGLKKMEEMGQMSNAEEATVEDDGEFESEIDDILSELDSEKEDEGEEEDEVKMAVGGAVMPNDVTQQTKAALAQPAAPVTPAPAPSAAPPAAPAPMPTQAPAPVEEGIPASQLIAEDIQREGYTPEEKADIDMLLSKVAGSKAVALREKNTILLGVADEPGYLTLKMFSTDTPDDTRAAVATLIQTIQKARIKGIRGTTKNEDILAEFEALGYNPEISESNGSYTYSVDMQPKEAVQ